MSLERQRVTSDAAPRPIGPYSQAIRNGELIFCSGQIGLDPQTGALVPGGIAPEARQALKNLEAVLEAAGSSLGEIVKTTIFLVDMADFPSVNALYAEYVGDPPPARSTVGVASLPAAARVEIEAIARAGRI